MKIFNASQTRHLDQATINKESVSSIDLMERASREFVKAFVKEISPQKRIFIFAGTGNNGGDALSIARLLALENYSINCFLINTKGALKVDTNLNKFRLTSISGINFHEGNDSPKPSIEKDDIIIDGLIGSGLNKPLAGVLADLVNYLNGTQAKIYSIDIPSGLYGEDNSKNISANIIKAYKTFTFQFPKLAFLLPDSGCFTQHWDFLDICLDSKAIEQEQTPYYYLQKEDICPLLRPKSCFDYKNKFGHALIVAGSKGKMGAAILCSKASMRAGAGLLSVYLPKDGEAIMQTAFPEAMTIADDSNNIIKHFPDTSSFSSVGIGPGIGTHPDTALALKEFLARNQKPLVLDADALNIISRNKECLKLVPKNSILTPHVGEFDRLAGQSDSSFERLQKARDLAAEINGIVVLKGAYTAICTPEKEVFFNSTGNPGMATAGSGDVLTGIITGLLAQNHSALEAAKIGVYVHGLAGDIAAKKMSQNSLIASDIVDNLTNVFLAYQQV
jgi:NAD(P)H-hydrate epimerase